MVETALHLGDRVRRLAAAILKDPLGTILVIASALFYWSDDVCDALNEAVDRWSGG